MDFVSGDMRALDDRSIHALRDIYYAEKKIASALPAMIERAGAELKSGFELQLGQTRINIERIEKIFAMQSVEPEQQLDCQGAANVLEEADRDDSPMDATMIAAAVCGTLLQQALCIAVKTVDGK